MHSHELLPRPSHVNLILICVQVIGRGLRKLLALPALVELTAGTFSDGLDGDWMIEDRSDIRKAALAAVQATFEANGRSLVTESCRI
jgi:hypothetical protein